MQPFADVEVVCVVDRSLGAEGASFFVVLPDPCGLVVHVERRIDALSDHPGAKPSGCRVGTLAQDPTVKDELDLVGATDVEVLPNDLLEEDAACHWLVEDLGQRELGLKDRHVIANALATDPWP